MVDIIYRLRNGLGDPFEHVIEAADEIERLREVVFSMNYKMSELEKEYNNLLRKQENEADETANENERLREALDDMIQFVRKEYGSNDVRVQAAEAVLKGKE